MIELTEQTKEACLQVLARTACNVSEACKQLKIGRTTFYNWCKEDEIFRLRVEDIRLSLIDLAESKLMSNIIEGKETSLIFFLTNRAPERWKHKDQMKQQTAVFFGAQNPSEITAKVQEIYGDEAGAVGKRIADALNIPTPSRTPEITE